MLTRHRGYDNTMNKVWDNINRGVCISPGDKYIWFGMANMINSDNGRTFARSMSPTKRRRIDGHIAATKATPKDRGTSYVYKIRAGTEDLGCIVSKYQFPT
jgi:hypothetical protein